MKTDAEYDGPTVEDAEAARASARETVARLRAVLRTAETNAQAAILAHVRAKSHANCGPKCTKGVSDGLSSNQHRR